MSRAAEVTPADEVAELLADKGDERPDLIMTGPHECTMCNTSKAGDQFYWAWNKRDNRWQRDSRCKDCHNSSNRTTTRAKVINRRARQRATALLLEEEAERFEQLLEQERRVAAAEYEMLAEHTGDAKTILRPGRRRAGESTLHRIDTAECRRCHRSHDAGHACPNCGFSEAEWDALEHQQDLEDLRSDVSRDVKEAVWS